MIKRQQFKSIESWLWKEKIIILKWARQVGKTTLIKTLKKRLDEKGKKTMIIYADDISNENIIKTPENLIYHIKFKLDLEKQNEKIYLFIDEFQYIENAGLFLKNIFDKYKEKLQIIVSGSSSLEITKNTEFLTGRNIEFYIDRINYTEFLNFKFEKQIEFSFDNFHEISQFYKIYQNEIERYFFEYLAFWWYPEVITTRTENEKLEILNSIFKNYIEKDVIDFLKVENVSAFNNLVKILSSQVWNLLNKNEVSNTIWLSRITLDKYLDILKWTFIFNYTPPYFSNIRKELTKMPKVFCEDCGILNYILWKNLSLRNEIDLWNIIENFVYRELNYRDKFSKLYFYQTVSKSEIDFVLESFEKKLNIFEVKYRNKVKIPVIFKNFENNYIDILDKKIMVTKDYLDFKNRVYFIPACILGFIRF